MQIANWKREWELLLPPPALNIKRTAFCFSPLSSITNTDLYDRYHAPPNARNMSDPQ